MKLVRLIRHAESSANAGLATAAPDSIPLTENGLHQARELAESIVEWQIDSTDQERFSDEFCTSERSR